MAPGDLSFTAEGLTVLLGGRELVRADSFSLAGGDIAWISAPSGAGKSTFLRGLTRLFDTTGKIYMGDVKSDSIPAHLWRRKVTLLPFPPVPLGDTIEEDLLAPFKLSVRKGDPLPTQALMLDYIERCGLDNYGLKRDTDRLSQGELARLSIVRTLLSEPDVLLLDEPTANVDDVSRELLAELVSAFAKGGRIVIATGHSKPWSSVNRYFEITDGELRERR